MRYRPDSLIAGFLFTQQTRECRFMEAVHCACRQSFALADLLQVVVVAVRPLRGAVVLRTRCAHGESGAQGAWADRSAALPERSAEATCVERTRGGGRDECFQHLSHGAAIRTTKPLPSPRRSLMRADAVDAEVRRGAARLAPARRAQQPEPEPANHPEIRSHQSASARACSLRAVGWCPVVSTRSR